MFMGLRWSGAINFIVTTPPKRCLTDIGEDRPSSCQPSGSFSGAPPGRRDTMYSCPDCGAEMDETATGDCWCHDCEQGYTRDEMVLMYGLLDEEEEDYQTPWSEDSAKVRDAIDKAFKKLNQGNVVARADFACCQGCGCGEIDDEAKDGDIGYCFYHAQDADNLRESGQCYLAFGALDEEAGKKDYVAIGRTIVAALKEQPELKVEWNGSSDTRILVSASGG
jgi:hypothetical protein